MITTEINIKDIEDTIGKIEQPVKVFANNEPTLKPCETLLC